MKILLIGSLNTVFLYSYADYFIKKGHDVFIINTSSAVDINRTRYDGINLYGIKISNKTKYSHIKKIVSRFRLDTINVFWWFYATFLEKKTLSEEQNTKIDGIIQNNDFDLAFCFWGTSLRKEIFALRTIINTRQLKLKIILSISTYPVRFNLPKKRNFTWNYLKKDKSYFECCDGLIISGDLMKSVVIDYLKYSGHYVIFKDFLFSTYFGKNKNYVQQDIIFLGNVRFDERTIDDVSQQLVNIADNNINVWVQEPCAIVHENIKTFRPFTLQEITEGKLGLFLNKFKASIVLYNQVDNLRMGTTYPTRFALATLGSHDIFIPKNIFDTLEEFGNNIHLYENLPDLINKYNAIEKNNNNNNECFSLDGDFNSSVLDEFIINVLSSKGS